MKSIYLYIIFLCFSFLSNPTIAQDKRFKQMDRINTKINTIDRTMELLYVDRVLNYKNNCGIDSASLYYYIYELDRIVLIVDIGYGNGKDAAKDWKMEYYFDRGNLIASRELYRMPGTVEDDWETIVKINYYRRDRLIYQFDNGSMLPKDDKIIRKNTLAYKIHKLKNDEQANILFECLHQ